MNKYAILYMYYGQNDKQTIYCLFRYEDKSFDERCLGYPLMIGHKFLACSSDDVPKDYFDNSKVYFSRDPDEDILLEFETDEEAILYFEVMEK